MESFFFSLKFAIRDRFSSRAAARADLFEYIEVFYKRGRMHTSNGDRSPVQFEVTSQRSAPRRQSAMEAAARVGIDSRFPPPLGQRSALPTAPTTAITTTRVDLE